MTDLIKRLEEATEGSRELDVEVAKSIKFFDGTRASYTLNVNLIPHYTTSIDAALTLVPEGWGGLSMMEGTPSATRIGLAISSNVTRLATPPRSPSASQH